MRLPTLILLGAALVPAPLAAQDAAPAAKADAPAVAGSALAGDAAAGAAHYEAYACATCHGPTARGMASFPRLAGKEAPYLAERLATYRAGERVGANSALMIPHAADLTDGEIADLAAHLASLD